MRKTDRAIHADPGMERLFTSATVVTFIRTAISLGFSLAGAYQGSQTLLVVGLVVYWVGDTLDGEVARWRNCETRIGAVIDMLSDRLNCAGFYLGWPGSTHHGVPGRGLPVRVHGDRCVPLPRLRGLADPQPQLLLRRRPADLAVELVPHREGRQLGLFAILLLVTGWWWLG